MDEITEVRKLVVDWFNNSYCPTSSSPPVASTSLSLPALPVGRARVQTIHCFVALSPWLLTSSTVMVMVS